ncbi:hypothetical protein QQP08_019119 [Theobroma cacao]|nr:hypothetical protein QQP08_019119 [Theobroma cacao]
MHIAEENETCSQIVSRRLSDDCLRCEAVAGSSLLLLPLCACTCNQNVFSMRLDYKGLTHEDVNLRGRSLCSTTYIRGGTFSIIESSILF